MTNSEVKIPLLLADGHMIELKLAVENGRENALEIVELSEAMEYGEAPIQLMEGCSYEYELPGEFAFNEISQVVTKSKFNEAAGRIAPNTYVGTLSVEILYHVTGEVRGIANFEIRSVKTSYRNDYRYMLEHITEKCTDLLMQYTSPVQQYFTLDHSKNAQSLYQRFAFVRSIIESPEFTEAVERIQRDPVTSWAKDKTEADIRKVRRMTSHEIKQIASGSNRIQIPDGHSLRKRLSSISRNIRIGTKSETLDTPENRFVKHVLTEFMKFCGKVHNLFDKNSRAYREAVQLELVLERMLSHEVFSTISNPYTLALNSPVLQRKEGYREVLKVWLMFDLAAKLVWKGGEDVYNAGKRDVAVLYEYWLFFVLFDLVREIFIMDEVSSDQLIEATQDGLGLKLKSGHHLKFRGLYESEKRRLNVEFSFNRTFSEGNVYPHGGSWTKRMRPDYTLSFWPEGITANEAEENELIVHIHFDAKYKIENLREILANDDFIGQEEKEIVGNYKRSDLLKMHAYKDAIRRTGGAYILYPGSEIFRREGFHELLPGLGAFPIRPSREKNGIDELKGFVGDIINHFLNRASQRERMAYHVYDIFRNNVPELLNESIPEFENGVRAAPPSDINVIVGFCKNKEHYKWIESTGLYNIRINDPNRSIRLNAAWGGARYILLHQHSELITGDIRMIIEEGARILSKKELIDLGYPNPSQEFYLVYKVEKNSNQQLFQNSKWDLRKSEKYKGRRMSGLPFVMSLTELMKTKVQ